MALTGLLVTDVGNRQAKTLKRAKECEESDCNVGSRPRV